MVKVRFAPSPTGYLHLGNIRTALHNYLFAINKGGEFILRFDDTDVERSKEEYAKAIPEDLAWLGIKWDEFKKQSDRIELYEKAAEDLKQKGRLYACYETAEELEYKRRRQRAQGKPPVYDRSALKLTEEEKQAFEAEGRKPHWRFLLNNENVVWDDLVRGECHYDTSHISDPVLIRADGSFLYTYTSVVDDADMDITHVVRGEDHVTNTAVQIQIFEAMGAKLPQFVHESLMTTEEGKFSKRKGSLSIKDLREDGIESMAINNLLAKLGTPDPIETFTSMEKLAETFDFTRFGRAQPKFFYKELLSLNAKMLHEMPYDEAYERCKKLGYTDNLTEEFWQTVRPNLERFSDIKDWLQICGDEEIIIKIETDDVDFIKVAVEMLPEGKWDSETWKAWTNTLKESTGRKGKQLFMPLRLAVTGLPHGPEMSHILPLIGKEKVLLRLQSAVQ